MRRTAMNATHTLSPSITNMIRMDHTHVLMLFRRLRPDTSLARKAAIVTNACLALEIHAQLEEEIFYPALREAIGDDPDLNKAVPEHDQMRGLITVLRQMEPDEPRYDSTFRGLIREVLHHVADEETTLLPKAEEAMADDLNELGAQMTRRRLHLLRPHAGEVAVMTAKAFPIATAAAAAGAVALGVLLLTKRPARHAAGHFLRGLSHASRLRNASRLTHAPR